MNAVRVLILIMTVELACPGMGRASEVIPETPTAVVVRNHPGTGKPLVCVTAGSGAGTPALFKRVPKNLVRPDYRMLDPKVKPKEVGYNGPVSNRTKVYALAATLAAGGIAGYVAIPVTAAGGGAAGGAAAYGLAGGAVATGPIAGALSAGHSDKPDDFTHKAESRVEETPANREG